MLKTHYDKGRADALAKLKLANLSGGSQAYNPTLNGQAGTGAPTNALTNPPTPAAAPMATGTAKSKVLG